MAKKEKKRKSIKELHQHKQSRNKTANMVSSTTNMTKSRKRKAQKNSIQGPPTLHTPTALLQIYKITIAE
jgi:hypothetical protein